EFVNALKKACKALNQEVPSQAIAIVPIGKEFTVRLIGGCLGDPARINVVSEKPGQSKDAIPVALFDLLGKNIGTELVFLRKRTDQPNSTTFRWVLTNPINLNPELVNGKSIASGEFGLL
ncbi:hypothetical protein KKC60_02485, partial [Patescibacteria group bacterium]|nr:hypothetical protein [Patescibacteria group bacterium]